MVLSAETFQNMSPLDLHVLSTPPAFVLSQDQTLLFNPVLSSHLCFRSGVIRQLSGITVYSVILPYDPSRLHFSVRLFCIVFKVHVLSRSSQRLVSYHALRLVSSTFLQFFTDFFQVASFSKSLQKHSYLFEL